MSRAASAELAVRSMLKEVLRLHEACRAQEADPGAQCGGYD